MLTIYSSHETKRDNKKDEVIYEESYYFLKHFQVHL